MPAMRKEYCNTVHLVLSIGVILFSTFLTFLMVLPASGEKDVVPVKFVGSEACKECHIEEYKSFTTYAKKVRSFQSIERLQKGLTPEEIEKCYSCHTTGYGKPGGFKSLEETPYLKNAGCEVCHGPGETHIQRPVPDTIKRRFTKEDCETCHVSERVKAFRYKPMIHGGAH